MSTNDKRQVVIGGIRTLLDQLIDRHAEAYLAAYPEIGEFNNFEKSGTVKKYIGMVWTNDTEKPDTSQLKIRGSESLAKNKMVELDLSAVKKPQSFFPGQIVAFSAEPFLRRQLTVKEFYDPMMIVPHLKEINTDAQINLMIACGPFMDPKVEDWSLFDALVDNIKSNHATHVVLMGPFVDIDNKLISVQYEKNWKLIFEKLVDNLHEHSCKIFIVPSTRDVLYSDLGSNYYYPTSEISVKLNLKPGAKPSCIITSISDPSQIELDGLYLDVTSADILMHFNKCTSLFNLPPGDCAVDFVKLEKFLQLDRLSPHILVLPDRFNTPSQFIEGRLVLPVQRCSTKKCAVLIEIPKIECSRSVKDHSYKLIELKGPTDTQTSL